VIQLGRVLNVSFSASFLLVAQRVVWASQMCVCAALALKMWRTALRRVFPLFFSYLIFRLVRGGTLYALPYGRNLYGWVWLISSPLSWLASILVVLELYARVLRSYPGIASLSRWLLSAGLAVSITLSGLTLWADFGNPGERFPVILLFTVIERGVLSSLAIFLLMITVFLTWYPVPLSRNVIVHSMVCALYFLGATMSLLVRNVTGHEVTVAVNVALAMVDLACFVLWTALLSRAGEVKMIVLRQHWRPEQQQRLMDQLAAINTTLLRAAGRSQ